MTRKAYLETDTYAIVTEPVRIDMDTSGDWVWGPDRENFLTFRVVGSNQNSEEGISMGIAPQSDVDGYLNRVSYDEIVDWRDRHFGVYVDYKTHPGELQPELPADQTFWAEYESGTGEQTLKWVPEGGSWVLVLMNQDGSAGVDFEGVVGARFPSLVWLGWTLLITGMVVMVGGVIMIYFAARRPTR